MTLVDLAADGSVTTMDIPFEPLRRIRTLRGRLAELLAVPEASDDLISVVLTDETPQIDPMKRIRGVYPNAVQLAYDRSDAPGEERLREGRAALERPQEVIADFVNFARGREIDEAERALVDAALADLVVVEDDA